MVLLAGIPGRLTGRAFCSSPAHDTLLTFSDGGDAVDRGERVNPRERFDAYLERRVFAPLGVNVEWRLTCGDRQAAAGRRRGLHGSTRNLPAALVTQLFRPSSVNSAYGMSWWLRGGAFQTNPAMGAPGIGGGDAATRAASADWLPRDLVMAAGAGKQRLYLIPSQELVIVRMGPVRGGRAFADVEFLAALLR